MSNLAEFYAGYIHCLNDRGYGRLGDFVAEAVAYNGVAIGLPAFIAARAREGREIPDLRFDVVQVVTDERTIACRIHFDIHPMGELFGLPINGRRIVFDENVFYEVDNGLISRIWAVIDRAAIAEQLT